MTRQLALLITRCMHPAIRPFRYRLHARSAKVLRGRGHPILVRGWDTLNVEPSMLLNFLVELNYFPYFGKFSHTEHHVAYGI